MALLRRSVVQEDNQCLRKRWDDVKYVVEYVRILYLLGCLTLMVAGWIHDDDGEPRKER